MLLILLLLVSQEPEKKLEEIRKKLNEQRKNVQVLKIRETGILRSIQEIDNEITLTRKLVDELKKQTLFLHKEIKEIESIVIELDYNLKQKKVILSKRIRNIYKYGKLHPLAVILLSYSFDDALKRMKYLTIIAEQDLRIHNEIKRIKGLLDEKRIILLKKLGDLDALKVEAEIEEENLQKTLLGKKNFLSEISSKREQAEIMAKELERAEQDLKKLIASLPKQDRGKIDFFKTKLIFPVEGKIIGKFGFKKDPKYGTITKNNGIDISAPFGEKVKVVADGKVVFADNFLGYGKMVIVDHGNGFISLYAHLSTISVEVGNDLRQGDIVGLVGDTGSLDEPQLHFEIRRNGQPVDPMHYLGS